MIKLTPKQIEIAQDLNSRPEIARCRKGLIMYKSSDPAYARFRVTAGNHYGELITRLVAHRPLLKATRAWLDIWLRDPGPIGDTVCDLFHALERESGYKFKNYKAGR